MLQKNTTGDETNMAVRKAPPPKGQMRQSLPEDERRAMGAFMDAIEGFRKIRPTMPLQYVYTFLLVAYEESLGVTEYAKRAGVSQSVMSRHLLDIGDRNRYMTEGFGLVTQRPDPLELRKHQVILTDLGRALAHQIFRAIRK